MMRQKIRKWKTSPSCIILPLSDNPHAVAQRVYKLTNLESVRKSQNEWQKNKNKETRAKIITLLGGKCVQCGYSGLALQIDHVNGGGTKERQQSSNSYIYYSRIIEKLQFGSKDYQLLCANCNWIKRMKSKEEFR